MKQANGQARAGSQMNRLGLSILCEQLLAELREAGPDPGTYYLQVTRGQIFDLAQRYVPASIEAMCLTLLEWDDLGAVAAQNSARISRPSPARKNRKKRSKSNDVIQAGGGA